MNVERSRRRSSDKNLPVNLVSDLVVAAINSTEGETPQPVENSSVIEENKTPENIVQDDVLEKIEKELTENPSQFSVSLTDASPNKKDFLNKELSNKIIKVFADKSGCTENLAVIGITALVQAGGTNASMPPITKVINGKKFDLKVLRECVAFVTEKKGTVRQLAKSMRNIIHRIALQNGWPGPLAIMLTKEYPEAEFTTLDLITAAEFHEDNMEEYMPSKVREALVDRAKKLRAAKLQPKKTKPKRKGGKKKR
jgi:hypothetical protein